MLGATTLGAPGNLDDGPPPTFDACIWAPWASEAGNCLARRIVRKHANEMKLKGTRRWQPRSAPSGPAVTVCSLPKRDEPVSASRDFESGNFFV